MAGRLVAARRWASPIMARPPTRCAKFWPRLRLLSGVALCVTIFRDSHEQNGNMVALRVAGGTYRYPAGSRVIATTWFPAVTPLVLLVLTPFLVRRWNMVGEVGRALSSISRLRLGGVLVGVSYLMLGLVARLAEPECSAFGVVLDGGLSSSF